jgi:hypothetical protein
MRTFTRAGISTNNGKTAFRFTNDLNREVVLSKNGHTDIKFYELGDALTKEQAAAFMVAKGYTEAHTATPKPKPVVAPVAFEDDADSDFVEPKNEAVQVAMCKAARANPKLSAQELFELVA